MPANQFSRFVSLTRGPARFDRVAPHAMWGLLTAALGLWPSLTGCIDPEAKYEDFLARKAASIVDAGGDSVEDAGAVVLPEPDQLTGNYLYVVSADGYNQNPTVYELEVTAQKNGEDLTVTLRDRALKFKTYDMPVGDWEKPITASVSPQGIYQTPEMDIVTPAPSNVLGVDIELKVVFTGNVGTAKYAPGPGGKAEFWCGTVTGNVISPLAQPFSGKFTAIRIDDPKKLPKPAINCAGDIATFAPGQ